MSFSVRSPHAADGVPRSGKVPKTDVLATSTASGISCDPDKLPAVGTAMADGNEHDDQKNDGRLYSLPNGAMCAGCEIVRPLGAGSYGEVYLALDSAGQHCALKRMQMLNKDDEKTRRRFLQEARILSYVRHPNIVMCDGYGAERDGTLWMKLEYLQGNTLRELLHVRGTFPIEHVLRLGRQACQGLNELHKAQAAHRDIKPENLFLIEADILKVLDFGLVKLAESSLKTTGRIAMGTALYFAPDYLDRDTATNGDAPDVRWDVYSLGMTLYEMLAGHPFMLVLGRMPAPMVAAKMHLTHEIPDLSGLGIPGWVAEPIMKALARQPNDRWTDADAFERALAFAHERWLSERARETNVPRSTSAKVRLGRATTEPEVVQQLTRAIVVPRVARELVTAAPHFGPQGTERMVLPRAFQGSQRDSAAPACEPPSPPKSVPPFVASAHTEPLDRSLLRAEVASEPGAGARTMMGNPGRVALHEEHNVPSSADPTARDAAEIAVWLKMGYLPEEVARKMGLRVAPTTDLGNSPRGACLSETPNAGDAIRHAPPAIAEAPKRRAGRRAIPAAATVTIAVIGAVLLAVAGLRLRPAPTAEAGPITVPAGTAAPPPTAVEPSATATATQEPASTSTAEVPATASTSAMPAAAAVPPSSPQPKSSRANDLYPTPWDDDDPRAKAASGSKKPAPPKATAAPATGAKPHPTLLVGKDSDPPKPASTSILPFGKEEN